MAIIIACLLLIARLKTEISDDDDDDILWKTFTIKTHV